MALQDKIPGLNASYFLGRDTGHIARNFEEKWHGKERELLARISTLQAEREELDQRLNDRVAELRRKLEHQNRLQRGFWLASQLFWLALVIGIWTWK